MNVYIGRIFMQRIRIVFIVLVMMLPATVFGGEADVTGVNVRQTENGNFQFDVTVRHGDTGWEHYADRWEVLTPDGEVVGARPLHHPHENEQPFTRSLSEVMIPADITAVTIRAHDSVHDFGGKTMT